MLSFIIIFPIFAIAGLGFLLALTPLFDRSHIQGLSQFVFYVAIPALLFQSLSQVNLPEQINWQFVGSYYIVVIAIYAAGFLVNKLVFRGSRKSSAIFGMASSYSNMVLIGIPIVNATFGDDGLVPIVVLVSIHSALQFSTTTLIAESSMGDQKKGVLDFLKLSAEKIFKNPIIIAIFLGLLFNLLRLPISEYLFNTLVLLRSAALPTALFMMGGSLANYRLGGQMSRAFTIVALKMFIAPTLVYLLVTFVFDVPDLWAAVAVVTAALPVGINSAVFANKYDSAVAPVGSAVLLSTFLSIGTISFLLSIYA